MKSNYIMNLERMIQEEERIVKDLKNQLGSRLRFLDILRRDLKAEQIRTKELENENE